MANCKTCKHNTKESNPDISPCANCGEGYMYYEPSPNYNPTPRGFPERCEPKIPVIEAFCVPTGNTYFLVGDEVIRKDKDGNVLNISKPSCETTKK